MRQSELGLILWPAHLLFDVSPLVVMRQSELGLILWPAHFLSEVSPLVVIRRFELGLLSWMMTWQVGPTMLTWHADVTIMSCWRHPYPGQSRGSDHLVFGSGLPFGRRKCVARWCAWAASSPACVGVCGHVQRPISMPFSPVASSLPPLHSGKVKTQFWQLLFLSKKSNTTLHHKLWY